MTDQQDGLAIGDVAACPFAAADQRKTAEAASRNAGASREAVKLGDAASIRAVLRSANARQAGFGVESMAFAGRMKNPPVLFLEGEAHRRQRAATARFFAPKVVATRYRTLIEALSDEIIARFRAAGRADLGEIAMQLAVGVSADIIGLTNGPKGLPGRLESVFRTSATTRDDFVSRLYARAMSGLAITRFLYRDLRPAIRARRKAPREDVISRLLEQGYNTEEILSECLTYAAAGMVTTREFIVVAAWHMFDQPELRERFLAAGEPERLAILEEILRAEPVVGSIWRRTTDDVDLPGDGGRLERGTLIEIDIRGGNSDEDAVGACPHRIDVDRATTEKPGGSMFSFGDGAHRCPGASVAMHETMVFLDRLLRTPGLRLAGEPRVGWAAFICGYEVRGAEICCDIAEAAQAIAKHSNAAGAP